MDFVDIRAAAEFAQVKVGVVDPLGIERNVRIGDRAVAAADEEFFLAIGMQQHQIVAGIDIGGMPDFRPDRWPLLAVASLDEARRADVDDVVIDFDRRIGSERFGDRIELRRRKRPIGAEGSQPHNRDRNGGDPEAKRHAGAPRLGWEIVRRGLRRGGTRLGGQRPSWYHHPARRQYTKSLTSTGRNSPQRHGGHREEAIVLLLCVLRVSVVNFLPTSEDSSGSQALRPLVARIATDRRRRTVIRLSCRWRTVACACCRSPATRSRRVMR